MPMLTPQMHLRRRDMVGDGLPGLDTLRRDELCGIEGVASGGAGMTRHFQFGRVPGWGLSISEARYYGWRWCLHIGPFFVFFWQCEAAP